MHLRSEAARHASSCGPAMRQVHGPIFSKAFEAADALLLAH